jgi:hypothetical protein
MSLREEIADLLAYFDQCGPGPVSRGEYLEDADDILKLVVLEEAERAELEVLRDLKARVIGFGGDDYTIAPWIDIHRHHADEPYIGCPFCRDRFVLAGAAASGEETVPAAAASGDKRSNSPA